MSLDGNGISVGCISNSYIRGGRIRTLLMWPISIFQAPPVIRITRQPCSSSTMTPGWRVPMKHALFVQVVYKMAPRAKLGVGTADFGEVNFANVIRGLAGINSADFPNASTQGFAANVISR